MKKDLMNTQTGGEGETIQLAPETVEKPEDYQIDIQPVAEQPTETPVEPVAPEQPIVEEAVTEAVTEPVVPQQPVADQPLTEVSQGAEVGITEPSETISLMNVDFSQNEPKPMPNALGFNPIQILESDDEIDDSPAYVIELDEAPNPERTLEPEPPVVIDSPENEDIDEEVIYDADEDYQDSLEETPEPVPYNNGITPEQPKAVAPKVEEDFDLTRAFDGVNKSVSDQMTGSYENPYSVGTVKDYEPSTVVSKNFENGYAEVTGLNLMQVDELMKSKVGVEGYEMDELSRKTSDLSYLQNAQNAVNQAFETGDINYVLNNEGALGALLEYYGDKVGGDSFFPSTEDMKNYLKNNKYGVKALGKARMMLEGDIKNAQKEINDITDPKIPKENRPVNPKDRFDNRIKFDAKTLKKKYSDVKGFGDVVDYVSKGGFAFHTKRSLSDPEYDFPPYATLAYKMKKANISPELQAKVADLASRVYQKTINDYYEEHNADYLSFSGFSIEAKEIQEQDRKKLIEAREAVVKEVIPKYEKNVKDWEEKNNPILEQKISKVTTEANTQYAKGVNYISENNPEVKALIDEYKVKVAQAESPKQKKMLSAEFEAKLMMNESVKDLKEKRDAAVNAAVNMATSEYMSVKSQFLKANYNEAKQEFGDKFKKATFQVYRQQLNGDLNMYVNVDKLTRTPAFQKMSYFEKRKAIAEMWTKERKDLQTYLLGKYEYYPKNADEGYKHFTEWTGRREKSPEKMAQDKKELWKRIGRDAMQRYYFYAVDELLNPPNNKPSPYVLKSMAKDELAKIEMILKHSAEMGRIENADDQKAISREGKAMQSVIAGGSYGTYGPPGSEAAFDYREAKDLWQQILDHPENDTAWWEDLGRGIMDGGSVPILGSLIGFGRQMNLKQAVDNYQSGNMSMAEISLVQANASLNKLNELVPPSISYQVGNMLGQTTTIAAEMLLTGGVFRATSQGVKTLVDDVVTKGVKALYKADNAMTSYALDVMSNPVNVERLQNVVGFLAGTAAQTAVTGGNTLQMAAERMTPQMTAAYGGVYDPLIVQIDANSEELPEALLKAFGVNWSSMMIERTGGVLGGGKAKQAFAREMGSSDFLKKTLVGRWARTMGFKNIDEASEYIAKNKISFSNLVDEAIVEELVLSKTANALITGDEGAMDYSSDEVISTILGVGLFSTAMNMKGLKHQVFNTSTTTEIKSTNQQGESVVTQIPKDTWKLFNTLVGKDMSVKEMVTFLENQSLSEAQENALLNVYSQVKGKELRNDPSYKKAKQEFESTLGDKVDDSFLDEAEVKVFDEKPVEEVSTQTIEQESEVRDTEEVFEEPTADQVGTGVTEEQAIEATDPKEVSLPESSQEEVIEAAEESSLDEETKSFLESMKMPEVEEIQWEEKTLGGKEVDESDMVSVYHGGSVSSFDNINSESPLFVSEDKSQAESYASGNEGSVSEFKLNPKKIASEEEVYSVIKELGVQSKDADWSVDELSVYELIDPRFETSLSDSDIQKVYKKLEEKGYGAAKFTDSNLDTLKQDIDNVVVFNPKVATSKSNKTEVISEVEDNPFLEFEEIGKKRTAVSKRKAEKDFEKKYPEQLTRVKEIDANFDDIVSQLESNKLIEKIC